MGIAPVFDMSHVAPSGLTESWRKNRKFCGFSGKSWARFFVAVHPAKTAQAVAANIGVSASTVENWLDGSSAPSAMGFIRAVNHYGPACLAAAFEHPPLWLDATARAARRAEIQAEIARLAVELEREMEHRS